MDSSDGEFRRSVAEASPLPASMAPKLHFVKQHRSKLLLFPVVTTISCLFTLVYIKYSFLNLGIQSDLFCSAKSKIYLQMFTRGCVCEVMTGQLILMEEPRNVDSGERKNSCQIYIFKFLIKKLPSKFITLFVSVVVLRPLTHKSHPVFYEAALAQPHSFDALYLLPCSLQNSVD